MYLLRVGFEKWDLPGGRPPSAVFTFWAHGMLKRTAKRVAKESKAEWFAPSGWLKKVAGLDPARTFSIHPALLSVLGGRFGEADMYSRSEIRWDGKDKKL